MEVDHEITRAPCEWATQSRSRFGSSGSPIRSGTWSQRESSVTARHNPPLFETEMCYANDMLFCGGLAVITVFTNCACRRYPKA